MSRGRPEIYFTECCWCAGNFFFFERRSAVRWKTKLCSLIVPLLLYCLSGLGSEEVGEAAQTFSITFMQPIKFQFSFVY